MLLLDTNILISHLAVLQDLSSYLSRYPLPPLVFLIPSTVIRELDGLKSNARLIEYHETSMHSPQSSLVKTEKVSTLATKATHFLLAALREMPHVFRGQKKEEGNLGVSTDRTSVVSPLIPNSISF